MIQQCKKTYCCHLFSNLWKLHHKWFHTICLLNSLTFMNEFFANILIDCLENTKSTRRALHFVADDEHLTHALPMNNITSQQSFWHSNLLNVKQSHKSFHLFDFRDNFQATKSPAYLLTSFLSYLYFLVDNNALGFSKLEEKHERLYHHFPFHHRLFSKSRT